MSATYARNATKIPCLICGGDNTAEAVMCGACSAPMALVHDSITQRRSPQIVSIIGDSNVGKTVYLGFLLDMLTQRAGAFEAIPKGAYSVDLQQTVISHMANRVFPPKTPMEPNQWYWAYYQIGSRSRRNKWVDLIMPDMAGESLAAEISAPRTFQVIQNLLARSAGTMILIDAAQAANGSTRPDFFGLKIMSYLDSMFTGKRKHRIKTPTAIVLCKGDHCPEVFDDPRLFAKVNLNRLWNMCESRFECVEFFATTVVGSLGYVTPAAADDYVVPVPFHVALQGILEPFEWIVGQL